MGRRSFTKILALARHLPFWSKTLAVVANLQSILWKVSQVVYTAASTYRSVTHEHRNLLCTAFPRNFAMVHEILFH